MFFEEWELLTEPLLLQPLPQLNLSGIAVKNDKYVDIRKSLEE